MIGGVIFTIMGIIVIFYGKYISLKDSKTEQWNNAIGEIIDLKLSQTPSTDTGWDFECKVEYSFLIGNNLIKGNKITNSIGFSSDENFKVYNKLKKAKKVRVYYNPVNYNQSCLVKGKTYLNSGIILIGIMAFLFGLLILYFGLQEQDIENNNEGIEFVKQ